MGDRPALISDLIREMGDRPSGWSVAPAVSGHSEPGAVRPRRNGSPVNKRAAEEREVALSPEDSTCTGRNQCDPVSLLEGIQEKLRVFANNP